MMPLRRAKGGNQPAGLFLQTELLDKRIVVALIVGLEIAEMIAAVGDHLEKSATRMKILRVLLEMLRKLVDLPRKKRNLHIRRASVSIVQGSIFYDCCLFLSGKHGDPYPTTP